jgi:2-polyprenyl-3-methyl-5-hydroxy-6-metoxy-1,4-benzoquinol methylase
MTGTYDAELYDVATPDSFGGDVDWYRRKARESGGPILELGAGTGRITLPIAQDGLAIHALDVHRGMLTVLKRKIAALPEEVQQRITVAEGDMRAFRADRKFQLIIIPFRAFLHNLTVDDQLACLRCAHEHLHSGGHLAFNVFHPSLEYMAQHVGALAGVWRWTGTHRVSDGGCVVRSEANRYSTVQQRVLSQHRFEQYDAEGNLTRTFLHRLELAYLYPADIRRLLEQSGFEEVRIAGGFTGQPFAKDTDELVVEATRP